MKKFRLAALAALVFGVFTLTGCADLWGAAQKISQDKWCKKTVSYGDGKSVEVYMYYTNTATSTGKIDLPVGLTIVVEAKGNSVKLFGESITSGEVYATKHIAKGKSLASAADADDGNSSASKFVISDSSWFGAYEMFKTGEKDVSAPASSSSSSGYDNITDLADASFWKELLAEKLIDLLLGE